MKTIQKLGFVVAMILFLMAGQAVAQESDADLQKRKEEEKMKKEMQAEQMKAKKEQLETQRQMMEKMEKQYVEQQERQREAFRNYERASEAYSTGVAYGDHFVLPYLGQENQTQLTLRNSFRGGSDSSKGEFDVEEGARYFRCIINGKVRSGSISIKVIYPGNKTFKELTITSSAEVNYSQSLTIREGEEKKYIGTWRYSIEADKAEGNYMLQMSTN